MKKIYVLFISIVNVMLGDSPIIHAQTYYPFPTTNATWTTVEYGANIFPTPIDTGTWHFGVDGDTVINGLTYYKLYVNPGNLGYINPEPYFNITTAQYCGAYREDSSKKVYYWSDNDPSEYLLYDFSLQVGDTFCFNFYMSTCGNGCHQVSNVDSILINGTYRKQIHFTHFGQNETWIEGIGSVYDNWLGAWCFLGNIWYELNCHYQNGIHFYGNCDYQTTGLHDADGETAIIISPNPFENILSIKYRERKILRLAILDVSFKQLLMLNFDSDKTIDVTGLADGLYYYQIFDEKIMIQSGKLIKLK